MKGQIQALEEGDLKPENVQAIAKKLGVTEEEVQSMNRRLAAPDHSLNAPLRADSRRRVAGLACRRCGGSGDVARRSGGAGERQELLAAALSELNDRERRILTERRLKEEPTTLDDLSKEFGISRERVRQIEVRAFEKLQRAMKVAMRDRRRAEAQAAIAAD